MSSDLPARMLQLIGLLQTRRVWSGSELTERLGVTGRTVRRDIERLRRLGYPVEGSVGQGGGYQLTSGAVMPPLLLDGDEAVAIAAALIVAATSVAGMEETALRALAKLQHMLPARHRERVDAVQETTVAAPTRLGPPVDAGALALLACACRDNEIVTFAYRARTASISSRRVEPHSLVTLYGRWYLVAYDLERDDWRTFRLDRLSETMATGHHVPRRAGPAHDIAEYVAASVAGAPYRYEVRVTVHAPARKLKAKNQVLPQRIQPCGENTCTVNVSDDSLDHIANHLVALSADFTIGRGPPELAAHLNEVAHRLTRAAQSR